MKIMMRITGSIVFAIILGFAFTGCDTGNSNGNGTMISGITVSPSAITVERGRTQQFTAVVDGVGLTENDKAVTWSVSSSSSSITANGGLLTVAGNETANTLMVTATSVFDGTTTGTATVTVTGDPLYAQIYGTITLTHIPSPPPQVFIEVTGKIELEDYFWDPDISGELDLSGVTGTTANIGWSIPIPDGIGFVPGLECTFYLFIEDDSLSVRIPGTQTVGGNFHDAGNIGKVGLDGRIGEITGTITLTDIPDFVDVYIDVYDLEHGFLFDNWETIDLSGVNGTTATNIGWSIPIFDHFDFVPGFEGYFDLFIDLYDEYDNPLDSYKLPVTDFTIVISDYYFDAGFIGSVSLAAITLNGTITVTYGGQPVPNVEIVVTNYETDLFLGETSLESPGPNASWSVYISKLSVSTEITIDVYGYDSDWNFLFEEWDIHQEFVHNQDVSGIVLNLGDM